MDIVVTAVCRVRSVCLDANEKCCSPLGSPGTAPGMTAPGVGACTAGAADTPTEAAVISPPAIVFARCGARCLNAAVAAFTAVSDSILTALGRGSFGGGTGASTVAKSTISPEESDDRLDVLLFERRRVSQSAPRGNLRGTSTGVVACTSISPVLERDDRQGQPLVQIERQERQRRRTSHILHRNLELFPAPAILAPVHLSHHILELYKSRFRFVTQIVLGDFVPVFFWHLALDTTDPDLFKPLVHRHIPLTIAVEPRWVLPGCKHRVEVKFFDLESLEHSLEISSGKRERVCDSGKATTVTETQVSRDKQNTEGWRYARLLSTARCKTSTPTRQPRGDFS